MRLTPYFAIFFFLCQSIYAQIPESTILEGNSEIGFQRWPLRFNQYETIIVEEGKLKIERKKSDGLSIALASLEKIPSSYTMECTIEISGVKSPGYAGIIVYAQKNDYTGFYIEFSNKKQFRVYQKKTTFLDYLSGNPKNNGWVKHKALRSKQNNIIASIQNDELTLEVNGTILFKTDILDLTPGLPGFFCSGSSLLLIHNVRISNSKEINTPKNPTGSELMENSYDNQLIGRKNKENPDSIVETPINANNNSVYKELFETIKIKAERQQSKIAELQKELDRCNAIIDMSTKNDVELEQLRLSKINLEEKMVLLVQELEGIKKRNDYLEYITREYQSSDDGDLLINLTELITSLKATLNTSEQLNKSKDKKIIQLKSDKEILLREIQRLRNNTNN